ncbi:hypothetical protein LTR17_024262, partial [Elasticomyces elasticus]
MASTATFDTVELLENIILFLPLRRILQVQRVSKQWQNTVQGSVKTRRALFLEPSSNVVLNTHGKTEWRTTQNQIWQGKALINPLVKCFRVRYGKGVHVGNGNFIAPTKAFSPYHEVNMKPC